MLWNWAESEPLIVGPANDKVWIGADECGDDPQMDSV